MYVSAHPNPLSLLPSSLRPPVRFGTSPVPAGAGLASLAIKNASSLISGESSGDGKDRDGNNKRRLKHGAGVGNAEDKYSQNIRYVWNACGTKVNELTTS